MQRCSWLFFFRTNTAVDVRVLMLGWITFLVTHYTLYTSKYVHAYSKTIIYVHPQTYARAQMQRLVLKIIESKEFWIICCSKLQHAVTITFRSFLDHNVCQITKILSIFQEIFLTLLRWRNNRNKIVYNGYLVGFHGAFTANTQEFQKCLLIDIAWKCHKTYNNI